MSEKKQIIPLQKSIKPIPPNDKSKKKQQSPKPPPPPPPPKPNGSNEKS